MAKTRWGVIGAAGWADHTFGQAIEKARGAQLVAVLSSDKRRAAAYAEKHGCQRAYVDGKAFASDPEIDAVWVASPAHLHARQAIACLEAGKHVLCEKPMATSAADCEKMIAAAKKAKRLLSIGFQMRHVAQHAEAARLASSGALGKIAMIRAHFFFPYGAPPAPWRQSKKESGGWAIGDLGVHLLDLMRACAGEVAAVEASFTSHKFHFETEDLAVL
ncbi:MAG: Gfo/Idh/MocA family oxidoreductase, partial [Candidatus Sumerlaeota bacterium]|nr:Gfo/Idh/MocA family oxidoreductase [Candidatus Sumerlaeota bacterium]